MLKTVLTLSLMLFFSANVLYASNETIEVNPGLYSFTTTTRSSMRPKPKIETEDDCVEESSVSVKKFMPDDDACSYSNVKKSGNQLTFDIKCAGGNKMPSMTGKAEVSATPSTVKSHYKMVGSFQGHEFSVNSESEGKRTGPCK